MKLNIKLRVLVAHPYLPGEEEPPDIYVSVHRSALDAAQARFKAQLTLAEEKTKNPELPRYAVEEIEFPLEIKPLMGPIVYAAKALAWLLSSKRRSKE